MVAKKKSPPKMSTSAMKDEIADFFGSHGLDVQFDDGTVLKGKPKKKSGKAKVSEERIEQMMLEMCEGMQDFNDKQIIAMHAAMEANRVKTK